MPLLDHFKPPLSLQRPWEGIHGAWVAAIATQLNHDLLPPDYFAMPLVIAGSAPASHGSSKRDCYEVQVLLELHVRKLRVVIALICPRNKERPNARITFATRCAAYLQNGVAVAIIDIVTEPLANLHEEIRAMLDPSEQFSKSFSNALYAVFYRPNHDEAQSLLAIWPHTLKVGERLPTLPLWLDDNVCIPLDLERSYAATCKSLRIAG